MSTTTTFIKYNVLIKSILVNTLAICVIYFTPALSHLLNFPLYLIEPMRLMLVFALVHTNKKNAYLLALTLPIVSFLISGHPVFFKMLLIAFELSFNVLLFYLLIKSVSNLFMAAIGSILLSKLAYYGIKYLLLKSLLLNGTLISTPLYIQIIMSLAFTLYIYFALKHKKVTYK